ncbi:ABC transporter ATP-binding protein [Candidatus Bathyarchaeota archaeon]|nr:MAG: ABC transporter ATP-binding protein [Candidatus Bathyarchaeota archaeon]
MPSQDTIQLQHIGLVFDDQNGYLHVLDDINVHIRPQEFLCVLGPSGCGKTTLLRVLAGLDEANKGKVIFPGKHSPRIGIVFQESNLMPWRTVLENILLPLELKGTSLKEAQALALNLIELVDLQDFQDVWPRSLSGGMAQRVAIARALIQDPDLLLLDEPFRSLDAITREQMGTELLRVWQARRKTVVMVTHSISEALLLADRVLVLTQRPACVRLDLVVDLERPRHEETRYSKHFQDLAKQLRAAIS